MNRRRYLKSSAGVAALAAFAGCSGGDGGGQGDGGESGDGGGSGSGGSTGGGGGGGGDPIHFGYSASLSGPSAVLGQQYHVGFQIWRDHVNDNGGILDREVRLTHYDDESDPARARELANRLVSNDNVDFLFGPYGSPTNFSASVVSQQQQIPMVSGAASDPSIFDRGLSNFYSTLSKTDEYGKSFPQFLTSVDWGSHDMEEPTTVAAIRADAAFTSSIGEALMQNLEEEGFEIAFEQDYPLDLQDFSNIIGGISNANPDILSVSGFPADEARFAEQAMQADLNVDVHMQNYSSQTVIVDTLGEQVDYMLNGAWWDRRYDYERVDTYVEMWNERQDAVAEMPLGYATSAGMVYENAIEEAGSANVDDVNQAISNLDVETTVGRTQFHETGWNLHQASNEAVRQWQDQENELLYPEEFSTSSVWFPTPDWGDRNTAPQ